jgi:hypothetical protein
MNAPRDDSGSSAWNVEMVFALSLVCAARTAPKVI